LWQRGFLPCALLAVGVGLGEGEQLAEGVGLAEGVLLADGAALAERGPMPGAELP
jgi:hypothetical protein